METDVHGLEVLDREECFRLLGQATVGRIAFHRRALPQVLPVNFVVDEGNVVFRTSTGSTLDAATRGSVVAFEVDAIDRQYHTGWSVVVTGVTTEITGPAELARVRQLPLADWADRNADHYLRITTGIISGRRITTDRRPTETPSGEAASVR